MVPVDGLWVDDVWYYGGSPATIHVQLVRANPHVTMHLPDPWKVVVVQGEVRVSKPSPELAQRLADLANSKHAEYGITFEASSYSEPGALHPRRVIAWSSFPKDVTRFTLANDSITTVGSGGHAGRLADLDQVPVGVAHVAADLAAVDLGWREELGPAGTPLLVDGLDISHPKVEEGAGLGGVDRWYQDDLGLVIGRSSTDIDDHPAIGQLDDRRLTVQHDLAAKHPGVEVPSAGHVRGHDEMGHHEPLAWGGSPHLPSALLLLIGSSQPPATPAEPTRPGRDWPTSVGRPAASIQTRTSTRWSWCIARR